MLSREVSTAATRAPGFTGPSPQAQPANASARATRDRVLATRLSALKPLAPRMIGSLTYRTPGRLVRSNACRTKADTLLLLGPHLEVGTYIRGIQPDEQEDRHHELHDDQRSLER